MIMRTFVVGKFLTNCYVLGCQEAREGIIIDPGFDRQQEAEEIFAFIFDNGLKLKFIIDTHGHPDHTCGNGIAEEKLRVPILIHKNDAVMLGKTGKEISEFFGFKTYSPEASILLKDKDLVKFGNVTLKVMHTPGHSPGGISLVGKEIVITGDTLFAGSIGRTDLPGSSEHDMKLSLKKLASLPDDLVAYPGHGPATKIGEEKRGNPFLQTI